MFSFSLYPLPSMALSLSYYLFLLEPRLTMIGIEFFLSEINGRDITKLIAAGREKLASIPAGGGGGSGGGGGGAVAAASGGTGSSGSAAPATAEPKKEEKAEEREESYKDMGFSLFD
ncbi:hypothetical protein Ancab_031669 [Ancistrocladus abbreviatus]